MTASPHLCFLGIAPTVGDTAIGQSILHALKTRTGLPVRVHANRPDVFRALPELDAGDEVHGRLPPIVPPALRTPAFPIRLQRLVRDLRATGGARELPAETSAALRQALDGCAGVVLQGGPNWNDRMVDRRRAFERWLLLEAARGFGCRVFHVGVSCGPFAWRYPERLWMAPLSRLALDACDVLFVRDAFSRPALQRLGVTTRVVESTDAAVFLPSRPDAAYAHVESRILASTARPRVVVAVRDFQPAYGLPASVRTGVLDSLARTLDVVQRDLADVFFLSTDHNPQHLKRTDLEIAGEVRRMMRTPGAEIVDVDVAVPSALKHLYGRFDAMISMRLHPTILALDHGVPCLLLSYDGKCDDFFTRLDLGDFVVPLAEFQAGPAVERVTRMLRDTGLRRQIAARFGELKRAHAADWDVMYEQLSARARELAAAALRAATETHSGPQRLRRTG